MSNEIKINDSNNGDLIISPTPIARAVGTRRCTDIVENFCTLAGNEINGMLEKYNGDKRATLTLTVQEGNEVRVSELSIDPIPPEPVPGINAAIKTLGDDGNIVSTPIELEFEATPKVTVKGVEIESSSPSYGKQLYDQLSSGFHFNEKLYNPEFEEN